MWDLSEQGEKIVQERLGLGTGEKARMVYSRIEEKVANPISNGTIGAVPNSFSFDLISIVAGTPCIIFPLIDDPDGKTRNGLHVTVVAVDVFVVPAAFVVSVVSAIFVVTVFVADVFVVAEVTVVVGIPLPGGSLVLVMVPREMASVSPEKDGCVKL